MNTTIPRTGITGLKVSSSSVRCCECGGCMVLTFIDCVHQSNLDQGFKP